MSAANHPDIEEVTSKKSEVQHAWSRLEEMLSRKVDQLTGTFEMQTFNTEVAELMALINEIDVLLSSNEFGNDLKTIQSLLKKHDVLQREIEIVQEKVPQITNKSENLCKIRPEFTSQLLEITQRITNKIEETVLKSGKRKQELEDSYLWFLFLAKWTAHVSWMEDIKISLTSEDLADNVESAEKLLEKHLEYQLEIDDREESYKSIIESGHDLVAKKHPRSNEVEEKLAILSKERDGLLQFSDQRLNLHFQNENLQIFRGESRSMNYWMTQQEKFLGQTDEKDTANSVETLLGEQKKVEKSLAFQKDKVEHLEKIAISLIDEKHFAAGEIEKTRLAIATRFSNLIEQLRIRSDLLQKVLNLKIFERNFDTLKIWVNGKLEEVHNDSLLDQVNLDGLLKSYRDLEFEVELKKPKLAEIKKAGEEILEISKENPVNIKER